MSRDSFRNREVVQRESSPPEVEARTAWVSSGTSLIYARRNGATTAPRAPERNERDQMS